MKSNADVVQSDYLNLPGNFDKAARLDRIAKI